MAMAGTDSERVAHRAEADACSDVAAVVRDMFSTWDIASEIRASRRTPGGIEDAIQKMVGCQLKSPNLARPAVRHGAARDGRLCGGSTERVHRGLGLEPVPRC